MTYLGDRVSPPWMVRPAPYAVPRPALESRLDDALDGRRVVGLAGPLGSGRTTLVRRLCMRPDIIARYPGGIGWLALSRPPAVPGHLAWSDSPAAADLTRQVMDTVRALAGESRDRADPERAVAALDRAAGSSTLIVVDDLRDAEQLALLRRVTSAALLFVTADASVLPRNAEVVRMEPMERAESVALVLRHAAGAPADRLAARAGDRPLQLVLAARIFGQAYRQLPNRDEAEAAVPSGGPDPVASAVAVLLEYLRPEVRDFFRGLASFPPDRDLPITEARNHLLELMDSGLLAEGPRLHEAIHRCLGGAVRLSPAADLTDLSWMCRRIAVDGLSALAVDVAEARAADGADPRPARLARVLRDDETVLGRARDARTLEPVLAARLTGILEFGDHTAESPVPRLVARWPPPDSVSPALLRRIDLGIPEPGSVSALAVAPDGSWIGASCTGWCLPTRTALWEPATGRQLRVIETELAGTMVVSADGSSIAVAGDELVHLCDVPTGRLRQAIPGRLPVIAADGTWLAVVDGPGTVRVIDARTGRQRRAMGARGESVEALVAGPDGSWVAGAGAHGVRIWDVRTGDRRRMAAVPGVTHLAVATDGSWLAAAGAGRLHLVDPGSGERRELLYPSAGEEVRALAVAPDGSWLAAAFTGRPVQVWDTRDGRLRHAFPTDGLGAAVLAVAPDGSWLAASDDGPDSRIRLWDPRTGASRGWLPGTAGVRSLAVAPDGSWLATGATGEVVLLDPSGTRPGAETAQTLPVNDLVLSGSWIGTAHRDGVRIWDRHGSTPRSRLALPGEVTSVAAGPTWLAAGTLDGVHLWEAATGRTRHTFPDAVGWGRELTAPAGGAWLAASGGSSPVHVWDTSTGHPRLVVPEGTAPIIAAPDGSWLAVCTEAKRSVEIWDLATGTRRHVLTSGMQVAALTVSADSNRLGAAHGPLSPFADHVWDVRTGEPCAASDVPAGEPVSSGGYQVNGRSLLRVWDGLPAELRRQVARDHRRDRLDVDRLATSPDGRWLAALSAGLLSGDYAFEGELRVYDLLSARAAARMPLRTRATGIRWSADGSDLFVWGPAGWYDFAWMTEPRFTGTPGLDRRR